MATVKVHRCRRAGARGSAPCRARRGGWPRRGAATGEVRRSSRAPHGQEPCGAWRTSSSHWGCHPEAARRAVGVTVRVRRGCRRRGQRAPGSLDRAATASESSARKPCRQPTSSSCTASRRRASTWKSWNHAGCRRGSAALTALRGLQDDAATDGARARPAKYGRGGPRQLPSAPRRSYTTSRARPRPRAWHASTRGFRPSAAVAVVRHREVDAVVAPAPRPGTR